MCSAKDIFYIFYIISYNTFKVFMYYWTFYAESNELMKTIDHHACFWRQMVLNTVGKKFTFIWTTSCFHRNLKLGKTQIKTDL